jgi:predicted TPR repeat methyltransferase
VKLLPTLRYAYAEDYIRRTLAAAGLQTTSVSSAAVRHEKGAPVAGLVIVARSLPR